MRHCLLQVRKSADRSAEGVSVLHPNGRLIDGRLSAADGQRGHHGTQ